MTANGPLLPGLPKVKFRSMSLPVLFHVPHASVEIPQEALGDFLISPEKLRPRDGRGVRAGEGRGEKGCETG
jgi:hypothetical protein